MLKITYILGICTNIYNVMKIYNDFFSLYIIKKQYVVGQTVCCLIKKNTVFLNCTDSTSGIILNT